MDDGIAVVTSFSPAGYRQYGANFIETFRAFWPAEAALTVYYEDEAIDGVDGVDLLETEPCRSFLERHADNDIVGGRRQTQGQTWKPGAVSAGHNFRFDAYKFCRKVFAIAHAARARPFGKMFWIDGDVQTHNKVTLDFLHDLLPDDASICHLPRPGYHTECGFVGYNLNREETRRFIADFEHVYAADLFFNYGEWHDSWIFDRLMEGRGLKARPIASRSMQTPVEHSVLGACFFHFKGPRKDSAEAMDRHRRVVA